MPENAPLDKEEEELMDPDTWDGGSVEVRKPVKKPRAVVSVAFPASDFELVAAKAREQGKTVSAFVREAALSRSERPAASISWSTTAPFVATQGSTLPTTRVTAQAVLSQVPR